MVFPKKAVATNSSVRVGQCWAKGLWGKGEETEDTLLAIVMSWMMFGMNYREGKLGN
jgi:hypothetical protein